MFSSFIGKNSTAEKARLLLAYSDFYINFALDLTSFLFRRDPQGGKNLIPAKKKDFFPSAFTLIGLYICFIQHFSLSSNEVRSYLHYNTQ